MAIIASCNDIKNNNQELKWSQLPQVPDRVGFAGAFAGISNDFLIVAGGANFPEGTRPWSGGVKFWNDNVIALQNNSKEWKKIGKLPQPMGYGISLSWNNGIVLIGGADQQQHYKTVYFLTYNHNELHIDTLPDLPEPLANSCGTVIKGVIYIAGGLSAPSSKSTEKNFWSLDLNTPKEEQKWRALQAWPGESRMLSVAGTVNDEFYLISGTSLNITADDTSAHRKYLTDAYVYNKDKGWRKIKDLPYPVTAAPTPAYTNSKQQLLIMGGDDGSKAEQNTILKDKHPGFRTEVLSYDPQKDEWSVVGHVLTDEQPNPENDPNASTWAPVTTPLVIWHNDIVLSQGEVRPGVRTNRVLLAKP